jgi:4-hydroxybenzoate polyprenyltransferase
VFLGLAFNWGALLAYAAHAGTVSPAALALYGAGIAWTLYYDTIYAHQDREDDALIGVKSTARLFGENSRRWLIGFAVLAVALAGLAVVLADARALPKTIALVGTFAFGAHMARQMRQLDLDNPASCLHVFRANRDTGLILGLFFAASAIV